MNELERLMWASARPKGMTKLRFAASAGPRDLHLAQLLTQMAIGYTPQGIIADQIFPMVRVPKQLDAYAIFSRQEALTIESTVRAPGSPARKITRSVTSGTFFAKNYALKADLVLEDRVNADPVYAAQLVGGRAKYILNKLMLDWDRRVSLLVNSTSNVGSSAAVASSWNGAGSPLTDIWTGIDNARYRTGYRPNKLVYGTKSWDAFSRDSTVRNLIFGLNNGGGYPTLDQVARVFGIEDALIGNAVFNNANEAQPESVAVVWPSNALLVYTPPAPSIDDPSFGYSFRWSAPGIPEMNIEIYPYNDVIKSDEIEAGYYQDEHITGSEYGFLLTGCNSST